MGLAEDFAKWLHESAGVSTDVLNRGLVAGTFGAPVDLAAIAMRPFVNVGDAPVGGSEWIGKQMERARMVSSKRRPIAEFAASLLDPATMGAAASKAAVAIPAIVGMAKRADKASDALKSTKTEFEIAHEIARRNAALPIDQGGLGLPPNNTATDRAYALAGLKLPEYDAERLLAGKVEISPAKQGKPLFKSPDALIKDGIVIDEKARKYLSSYLDHNQLDRTTGELRGKGLSKASELLATAAGKPTPAKFKDYTKEELMALAESDAVKRAHEVGNLEFIPMTKEQFVDKSNFGIYKSPSYGKSNPGSEYKIGVINGEPVYMRSADHWGKFGTNIGYMTPEEEALKQGLGVGDYYESVRGIGDPFGRVGKQMNNWELPGYERGDIGYGYIPLSKLSGRLPEKNYVSNLDYKYADLPIVKLPNGKLRSRFAAFDPMQRNSANILAGSAAGTIAIGALFDQDGNMQ